MRRFVLGLFAFLFAVLSLTVAGVWSASYRWAVRAEGTAETTRHQLIAARGQLYWWHVTPWWRHEDWHVDFDSELSSDLVEEWPGMSVAHHRRGLGFESASGMWKSPAIKVTIGDRVLEKRRIPVGSMFSAFLPFRLLGVPLWGALLFCFLVTYGMFWIWKRTPAARV